MSSRFSFVSWTFSLALALVLASTAFSQACTFRVNNNGSHTAIGLWVSASNSNNWFSDILGSGVLYPGYYVSVICPTTYCDVRTLFDNRQVLTHYTINTCDYNYNLEY